MAYIRKLRSGKWQATVRHPSGRRMSRADPRRKVVENWAADLEAEWRGGSRRDPRSAEITVAGWYERWAPTRRLGKATAATDAGRWRKHVRPKWGAWRLCDIARSDVAAWAVELEASLGAASVRHCVALLSTMLTAAVDDGRILANPARLPARTLPPKPAVRHDFYRHDEVAALLAHVRPGYRLMVELDAYTGLRWGEVAGLTAGHVDLRLETIHVRQVGERDGTLRPYAKSAKSHRAVPIPEQLITPLSIWLQVKSGERLFTSPTGRPLMYHNFLRRVWQPAIAAAGLRDLGFHGLRHTAASWLVMAGVDLYRVQAILGHESFRTTERYAHLAPDAHLAVTRAWSAMGVVTSQP